MSVEMNVLTAQYMGEDFTFLTCPVPLNSWVTR